MRGEHFPAPRTLSSAVAVLAQMRPKQVHSRLHPSSGVAEPVVQCSPMENTHGAEPRVQSRGARTCRNPKWC